MARVQDILDVDRKFRHNAVVDDIVTIDKLIVNNILDYDSPTLVSRNFDYNKKRDLCNNQKQFLNLFYELYPFLSGLDMTNLLIAGGSVGNIIQNRKSIDNDIDFFVYGLNVDDANNRVTKWVADVINCYQNHIDKQNEENSKDNKKNKIKHQPKIECEMLRNNNTIKIKMGDIKMQIMFRLYFSVSEILHGFDLGSSAVGFDGQDIYFTTLSKFCYENSCNIVDTTRRSTTYERRLEKYFERGFNIVMPKLDLERLRRGYFKYHLDEVCETPYFRFSYWNIAGNKIILSKFHNKYSASSDYDVVDLNFFTSFNINLYNLIHDIDNYYYVSSVANLDIMNNEPRISKSLITEFYEKLRKGLNDRKIDTKMIREYITIEPIMDVMAKLFDPKIDVVEYKDNLILRQIDFALSKLSAVLERDHSKINWLVSNPSTQLTSSYNPIIEDESKWYGELYRS